MRTHHFWTPAEEDYLRNNYELLTREQLAKELKVSFNSVKRKAYDLKLKKSKEAISKIASKPNAGQFTTGQAPKNTKHDRCLTLRIDKRGTLYYWIRVSKSNWIMYHVWLWLQSGNTIPDGQILRFKNGNTLKVQISNLQLVSRAEHLQMNRLLSEATITEPKEKVTVKKVKSEAKKTRRKLLAKKLQTGKQLAKKQQQVQKEKQFAEKFLKDEKTEVKKVDLTGLVSVRINAKTIVYVKPGTDIEKIKKQLNLV